MAAAAAVESAATAADIQIAQPPSLNSPHSVALFGCYAVLTDFCEISLLQVTQLLWDYFYGLLLLFCKLFARFATAVPRNSI